MKPEQQLAQIDRLTKPMETKFARAYLRFIKKLRPKVVGNVMRGGAPDAASFKKQLPRAFTAIYRDDIEASRVQADKQIGKGKPAKAFHKARRRRLSDLEEGASREVGVAGTARLPYATGATFDVDDLIEESLARLGKTLDTLDDRLERVLADAPDDLTDEELADLMEEEFDAFEDDGKIESIAETEVFGSVNGGRAQAFADNEIEWATWGTMQDNKVRETHRDFGESGVHPIGFNYAKLTDTPETLLRWPHDVECEEPGLVCNCRCALLWTDAPADAEDIYDEEMGDSGEEDKDYNPNQPRDDHGRFAALEGQLSSGSYEPQMWRPLEPRSGQGEAPQGPASPAFARARVHRELTAIRRRLGTGRAAQAAQAPASAAPPPAAEGAPGATAPPERDTIASLVRDTANVSQVDNDAGWRAVTEFASNTPGVYGNRVVHADEAKATRNTWAALVGAPKDSHVTISDVDHDSRTNSGTMTISFSKRTRDEEYYADRILEKHSDGSFSVKNESFRIEAGKEGLGLDVFERQVRAMTLANNESGGSIKTYGAGSPDRGVDRIMGSRNDYSNGYYTWARFGYETGISQRNFQVPSSPFDETQRNFPHLDKPEEWERRAPIAGFTGERKSRREVWEEQFLGKHRADPINAEAKRQADMTGHLPGSTAYKEVERQVRETAYRDLINTTYIQAGRPTKMSDLNKAGALWLHKAFGQGISGTFSLDKDTYSQKTLAAYRAERKLRPKKRKKDYDARGHETPLIPGREFEPQLDADSEAFMDLVAQVIDALPPEMVDDDAVAEEVVKRMLSAYTNADHEFEPEDGQS